MQTQEAIRARRNVRSYRPDPVAAADLEQIADAAWRAPSASNRQHWAFIIVTDPDQLRALSTTWQGAGHIAGAAAAIAVIVPQTDDDRTRLLDYYDLGQATYAIAVAAADLGIGTGHASVGDQDAARQILGVPADQDVAFLIGIGYPADRPLKPLVKPNRRPVGEVIRHGHW
jgi:nitroreductase